MSKAVLTTRIDPTYNDLPEKWYHFARTYLRAVEAAVGDRAIYHEPRRSTADLSSRGGRQSYFATAKVVRIEPDSEAEGYFYAFVEQFLPFARPVPLAPGLSPIAVTRPLC